MTAIAVIPARYASTRFPAKPLAKDTGKYLIQHVCERVDQARSLMRTIVATDDERIVEAVRSFGGEAVLTRADHASGTDRVAEVAAGLECDIVVNVQGDEPELEPASVDQLVSLLSAEAGCPVATLACPFAKIPSGDPADPAAVKVVVDRRGRALYFSRSLIPHRRVDGPLSMDPAQQRSAASLGEPLLHLGIYAYRRSFLLELAALPPTPLEQAECLEQLRVLEHGHPMAVGIVDRAAVGIDTPQDYAAFVKRVRAASDHMAPRKTEAKHVR